MLAQWCTKPSWENKTKSVCEDEEPKPHLYQSAAEPKTAQQMVLLYCREIGNTQNWVRKLIHAALRREPGWFTKAVNSLCIYWSWTLTLQNKWRLCSSLVQKDYTVSHKINFDFPGTTNKVKWNRWHFNGSFYLSNTATLLFWLVTSITMICDYFAFLCIMSYKDSLHCT